MPVPDRRTIKTFCRICVASCGLVVTLENDEPIEVRGDPDHPLSQGYCCPKGRALVALASSPERLGSARISVGGVTREASPEELIDDLADRLTHIVDRYGPDAVAVYASGGAQMDTSGWVALTRLTKAIGTRSRYTPLTVDAPAKPLVSTLMAGHPGLIPHVDPRTRLTLMFGTNPVVSHGHASALPNPKSRLRELDRTGKLVVIDPRLTESARQASTHLAIRPGSDFALLAFLVRALVDDGADRSFLERHTVEADHLRAAVDPFDVREAVTRTGLAESQLVELLADVRTAGRIGVVTGTGCTMSRFGNVTEWLAWCLAIVTGSFDQPGGMWFNPGLLAALDQRTAKAAPPSEAGPRSRPELRRRWHEYPAVALVDEIESRNVRALLVMGGNPISALPETDRVVAALRSLDVLAAVDIVETPVTALATHVLPAAGPLERADMTCKTEQLFQAVAGQYTRAVTSPRPGTKPMWWWCAQLGQRMGHDILDGRDPETTTDDDLLRTLCHQAGLFETLSSTSGAVVDDRELFGWVRERGLPFGHWRLAPVEFLRELADAIAYAAAPDGLRLTPRRQRKHFNSSHSPGGDPQELVLSSGDAADRGVLDGDLVRVTSPGGSIVVPVHVDPGSARGFASLAHGHGDLNVNVLTDSSAINTETGMPVYSGLELVVERADDLVQLGESAASPPHEHMRGSSTP